MEADTEDGGGGAGSGLRPSATFAHWPEDDAEGEVVPSGAGSSAGLAGQGGLKRRQTGPSSFGSKPKKLKGAAATTKREEAAARNAEEYVPPAAGTQPQEEGPARRFILCPKCGERIWL